MELEKESSSIELLATCSLGLCSASDKITDSVRLSYLIDTSRRATAVSSRGTVVNGFRGVYGMSGEDPPSCYIALLFPP